MDEAPRFRAGAPRHSHPVLLLRPPGVYRPQGDSFLLRDALLAALVPAGARVLDLGTGNGLLALEAARCGAGRVRAVDASRRAVLTALCNARLRGLPVSVTRGDLGSRPPDDPFDVVTANPPYLPCPPAAAKRRDGRAWNAGHDGRLHLDALCRTVPALLAPGGVFLTVHSSLCGPDRTLRMLREAGLRASVVARRRQPFGPVLRSRADWLEERGLITPGQREEELVVVRADCVPAAG